MNPKQKLQTLKQNRLCFNCMESRHASKWCKAEGCECGKNHAQVLHDVFVPSKEEEDVKSCVSVLMSKAGVIALPIVPVIIRCDQIEVSTHALLDPGSTRTFCASALCDKLNIKGKSMEFNLETLNKEKLTKANEVSFEVTGKRKSKHITLNQVLALDKFPKLDICGANDIDTDKWKHLKGLHMPENVNVQVLIGQDHPQALMPLEVRRGGDREPYAVRTVLGWTINGPITGNESSLSDIAAVCNFVNIQDVCLEMQVERFWKIDMTPDIESVMSVNDKRVLREWNDNLKLVDGHYQLPIPFVSSPETLKMPDNRDIAERRLNSLGRRLSKDANLCQKYKDGINDLIQKGYAEKVPDDQPPGDVIWYLPHHNVVNPNKTEKFRIVFDCASECNGISLNKRVLQGPDLTNKLIGVLMRFRMNQVALMGDIEGMFHQVCVEPQHGDALRFLWWKDGEVNKKVNTYRMTCHLFGGIWSPSAASFALKRTAEDNKHNFSPDVVSIVSEHFYVDDCLLSVKDEESAIRIFTQLNELVSKGGFRLTKWMSNNRRVLSRIPTEMKSKLFKELDLDLDDTLPIEKALGIHWNTETDQFGVKIKQKEPVNTRRGLLSTMSSVYDPMGMVAPYILEAKILFQSECRTKKGWDDQLEEETKRKWIMWLEDLSTLEDLKLDRCVIPPGFLEVVNTQLHHFSDASEKAYGAVSYLRLTDKEGNVHCCFLMGKSRLAPLRMISVPRLELLAAVISVHLDATIQKELDLNFDQSVYWSDSTIVLHYIKNKTRRFHTFVGNRITTIHEQSSPEQWRYVPTAQNMADDASRGLNAIHMVNSSRWLQGPAFLWENESEWPVMPDCQTDLLKNDVEVKENTSVYETTTNVPDPFEKLLSRYSDWFKLQKAVVWLTQFVQYCSKKGVNKRPITVQEMKTASERIIKIVQRQAFSQNMKLLAKLNPEEEDGILKVGGRIGRAPVSYELRHPIILPSKHPVTELIVNYYHKLNGHLGSTHVLSAIREKFWIIKGRASVRRVLHKCIPCKRRNALKGKQQMASLPAERLIPDKPPFSFTGVDYFVRLKDMDAYLLVLLQDQCI